MKKIFVTLAMIIACQGLFAQSIDDIFNQFKDKDGAEYINIPSFVVKLGRVFMGKDIQENRLMKGVKTIKVLDMANCSSDIKKELQHEINQLEQNGYETLVRTKEKDDTVNLIAKMDKDAINELIVFFTDKNECG
ncbi:MAG: DUF4252 domain-containing protein, partial [Bacteroidaceae bacterium]|nr:DUF4252 domain-containing protein [Bacteroidaceae bacterium]